MDDRERVLLMQYFLARGDKLSDDRKKAVYYLINNKFKFDYDVITCYKAVLFEKFFDDIMKEIFDLLEV